MLRRVAEVPVLLRFGVQNHRSIRDRQELSLIATSQRDEPSYRLPAQGVAGVDHGVLPVVGIYGANASGKSNLVQALNLFRDHVAYSFVQQPPKGLIPHTPWRLGHDPEVGLDTTFDVDVLVDGVRHHYGCTFTAQGFSEEWLHRWPKGRQQVVFERRAGSADPWYFGPSLTGPKATIAEATRPNALFLSAAAQFNHPELTEVFTGIVGGVRRESRISIDGHGLFGPGSPVLHEDARDLVLAMLRGADLGVHDMRVEEVSERVRAEVERGEATLLGPTPPETLYELHLVHGDPNDSWSLPPQFESRGTHNLLLRLNDILGALQNGCTIVVDELETSLHPDLCREIVGLFTSQTSNPRGAQLIFTTHSRDLLSVLRRDEIVLVDKGTDGTTRWSAASDFRGLRGDKDKRKAHEAGQLGGVPVLRDLARVWAEHAPLAGEPDHG